MDSSDGLSTTLNELSRQSGKEIHHKQHTHYERTWNILQNHKKLILIHLVFHGGEEYEFVFTTNPQDIQKNNQRRMPNCSKHQCN